MGIDSEEMPGKALTTSALASALALALFEFQDDATAQNGCSSHYCCMKLLFHEGALFLQELNEDTEIVVSFLKESFSPGESPEMGNQCQEVHH